MSALAKSPRGAVLALAFLGIASPGLVAATPANAASALQFGTFVADPSGSDRAGDNRQLNRETIVIRNTTNTSIKLAGYRVKDKTGHTYVFGKNVVLKKKASITVHTGKGTNSTTRVYWKQGNYVWNNTGDTAYLLPPKGSKALDTCTYRRGGTIKC